MRARKRKSDERNFFPKRTKMVRFGDEKTKTPAPSCLCVSKVSRMNAKKMDNNISTLHGRKEHEESNNKTWHNFHINVNFDGVVT